MERITYYRCEECNGRFNSKDHMVLGEEVRYDDRMGGVHVDNIIMLCHACAEELTEELHDAEIVERGSK